MMKICRISLINARKTFEILMPDAIPCKLQRDKYRETCRTVEKHKTKYDCIVEADDLITRIMKIVLQTKG